MYRVSILGETNDGISIDRELGEFDTKEQAVNLCEQLNELLRDKLLCIFRDLLEWRFDVSVQDIDGTYTCIGIMDSENDKRKVTYDDRRFLQRFINEFAEFEFRVEQFVKSL